MNSILGQKLKNAAWFFDSWYNAGTYYFPGRQGKLWTTTDWASWTAVLTGVNDDVYNIVNEEGISVVTGRSGNILTSTDQANWTNRKTGFDQTFSGVAYGAGVFVASDFNGNVLQSSTGSNWNNVFTPAIAISWINVLFADGKFVAMSSQGEWILSPTGNTGEWSLPSAGFAGFPGITSFRYLNGDWFAVGRDGFLRSSANLTTWATHDVVTTNDFEEISYGDGTFVVVGQGGAIYSSTDGTTWTERISTTANNLFHVTYGNGKFVVLGQSGTALTSIDGINWSSANQVSPPSNAQGLTIRDGQFEALDTSGRISLSSDGLAWTSVQTPVGQSMRGTAVSDTTMVVVGSGGLIMTGALPPPKNLVINLVGVGEVNISPEGSPYPHLSKVTLTAVANEDYAFSNWSGDAAGNANPLIVTMDADKTITANFVLALSGFSLWRFTQFTEEERKDDELSGPQADYDGDGLTNFEEYLLSTNPKDPNTDGGVKIDTIEIAGVEYLIIKYDRNTGVSGVTQRVEIGDDLEEWKFGPAFTEVFIVSNNGDGTQTVTIRILEPFDDLERLFVRLVLEE